jgi:phosphatidate cytidylyltransferase
LLSIFFKNRLRSRPAWINRELAIRLLTGFTLGPAVLAIVYVDGVLFDLLVLGMGIVATVEYYRILFDGRNNRPRIERGGWMLLGLVYIGVPLSLCIFIRDSPLGLVWILSLLITNWATDSFAYIGGHWFGKRPLAPSVSPHKTWEGAAFGVTLGITFGLLLNAAAHTLSVQTLGICVLSAPASVIGDLLESAFKRRFGVKDSGHILPGHGGILDRIDGMLLACAAVGLFLAIAS